MRSLILIAHNLRSTHNVGSLLRTADGLGVELVILSGYTPYPSQPQDERLPHQRLKLDMQIQKTALGAQQSQAWEHTADLAARLQVLRTDGYQIAAVEQAPAATSLPDFQPPDKIVLIVGREVEGLEPEVLTLSDICLQIPMFGQKESFNVVQAAAMALYHCRFAPF